MEFHTEQTEPETAPITEPITEPVMESEAEVKDYTQLLEGISDDLGNLKLTIYDWFDEQRLRQQSEALPETELPTEAETESNTETEPETEPESVQISGELLLAIQKSLDEWKSAESEQYKEMSLSMKESNEHMQELTNISIGIMVGVGLMVGVLCTVILSLFFRH